MAIDFPDSPSVDDEFTASGKTWKWTGSVWQGVVTTVVGPTGPTGPLGPTGPTGPETTISLGTVTTEDPGGTASVSIAGPAGNQVLDFAIPQGPTGPTGPTGPAGSLGSATLDDLSDVTINTPADNEILAYDNNSSEWINQTPSEAGLVTPGKSIALAMVFG